MRVSTWFAAAVCMLSVSMPIVAQNQPDPDPLLQQQYDNNLQRGFAADKLYQFGDVDNVNLFNGNMVMHLPIGQRYPVSPLISYSLTLSYNSQVWDHGVRCYNLPLIFPAPNQPNADCWVYSLPSTISNAGMGWYFTVGGEYVNKGTPYNPNDKPFYLSPDGAHHNFTGALNAGGTAYTGAYTYDGTHIRLRTISTSVIELDFPNGVTQRYEGITNLENGIFHLTEIRDRFSQGAPGAATTNFVHIRYNTLTNPVDPNGMTWEITDSRGRVQRVYFRKAPADTTSNNFPVPDQGVNSVPVPRDVVARVELQAFRGPRTDATAVYTFDYDGSGGVIGTRIKRDAIHDDDPLVTPSNDAIVALLTGVHLPDGSSYSMVTNGVPNYYEIPGDGTDTGDGAAGALSRLTLPTGGKIEWTYQAWTFPVQEEPRPLKQDVHAFHFETWGVATRTLYDAFETASTKKWTYAAQPQQNPGLPFCQTLKKTCPSHELIVTVTDPMGNLTEHFFSTCADMESSPWQRMEYGNPLTHAAADPQTHLVHGVPDYSAAGRYLSTITWDHHTSRLRASYVQYESGTETYQPEQRVRATRSVILDDSANFVGDSDTSVWTDTAYDDYDGYGHYRKTTVSNHFPTAHPDDGAGTDPTTGSTSYVAYNKSDLGVTFPIPDTDPWLLNRFSYAATTRTTHSQGVVTLRKEFAWDPHGFPLRRRTLRTNVPWTQLQQLPPPPAYDQHDLLAVFTPDADGNLASEAYYGGDLQSLDLNPVAATTPPATPAYEIDHQYASGVRSHSTYSSGGSNVLTTLDLTIDPPTSLAWKSRDAAGLETQYDYDTSGRLTSITPPSGAGAPAATTTYAYQPFSAVRRGALARVDVTVSGAASSTDSTIVSTHGSYNFDGFGRVVSEMTENPLQAFVVTAYDDLGRKQQVSERESAPPSHFTLFNYDPLGRVTTVTRPDGTLTKTTYLGTRQTVVSSYENAQSTAATSTQTNDYDAFGRLARVEQPTGSDTVYTDYHYDAGDRLSDVAMYGAGAPGNVQHRSFVYDNRGFLDIETHPENGTTTYDQYDARGHSHHKFGPQNFHELTLTYDAAERLRLVATPTTPVKEFVFDSVSDSGHAASGPGRLLKSVRHNTGTALGGDVTVTDYFQYDGAGRISSKETDVSTGLQLQQNFTYTGLGAPDVVRYPSCITGCTASSFPARDVTLTYWNGRLATVDGFATAIAYKPNGMIDFVQHSSADNQHDVYDLQEADASGMARIGAINFRGYCIGPAIDRSQPADKSVANGGTAQLSITPPAGGGVTYQWYRGRSGDTSRPINGQTGSSYTTQALASTATFWVRVTGSGCSTDSRTATVAVASCSDITISKQPNDTTVASGGAATFAVTATGPSGVPLQYQWYIGISGDTTTPAANGMTASLGTGGLTNTTQYWVRVSTGSCIIDSSTATATVCQPIAIVTPPPPQRAGVPAAGTTVTLSTTVVASGNKLRYAWYKGNVDDKSQPVGQNSPTFSVTYDQNATAGTTNYWVNIDSFDASQPGACTIPQKVGTYFEIDSCTTTITDYNIPDIFTVIPGGGNTWPMSATATTANQNATSSTFTAHWYHTWGTTTPEEILNTAVNTYSNGGKTLRTELTGALNRPWDVYWVVFDDGTCQVTSKKGYATYINTCPLPAVTVSPTLISLKAGDSATLTATADWPKVKFQWYRGSSGDTTLPISPGGTSPTLVVDSSANTYWCRVTDECGINHVDSGTVTVIGTSAAGGLCTPLTITQQPQSVDISAGESTTLRVDATAAGDVQFSWFIQGTGTVIATNTTEVTVNPTVTTTYYAQAIVCGEAFNTARATVRVRACPTLNVTQQPSDTLITSGQSAVLTVTASSSDTISYQWYRGDISDTTHPVGNGTSITVAPADTTQYWVRLTTASCTVDSAVATVEVCTPPYLREPVVGGDLTTGQAFTFSVAAGGTNLRYEWHSGTPSSPGPILSTSNIFVMRPQNSSTYFVIVSGDCGVVNSDTITVTVCGIVNIDQQPQGTTLFSGQTATLSVHVAGDGVTPIKYAWYDSTPGAPVPDNNSSPVFVTPPVTSTRQYYCEVTEGECVVDSNPATVTVCPFNEVVGSGATFNIRSGQSVTLNSGLTNQGPVYEWYSRDSSDPTHSTPLTTQPLTPYVTVSPTASTTYWASVQSGGCSSHTPDFHVYVCVPSISTQPGNAILANASSPVTLSVTASDAAIYQWFIGVTGDTSNPITGANSNSIQVAPPVDTKYWVRALGWCDIPTDSQTATVTVCVPPVLTQPANASIATGTSATLTASATGTAVTYQWYAGHAGNIATPVGSGGASLSVSPSDTTTYWVRASTPCGTADSTDVTVHVCATPTITTQPAAPPTIYNGTTATLNVVATTSTSEPLTYQWYLGTTGDTSAPISGATTASYTTAALTTDTSYWVRVSTGSACATADSATVTVPVCALPQNVGSPSTIQSAAGQTVRIYSPVTANQYIFYQGASGDTSHILNSVNNPYYDVSPTVTTQYWNQVNNYVCVANSATTTVNVCIPTITVQPAPPTTPQAAGTAVPLSVTATPSTGLTYQWYVGASGDTSTPLAGQTGASVTVNPTVTTSYWVRVSGSCSHTADSNTATVPVCTATAITGSSPSNQWVNSGYSTLLSVSATGSALSYQWYTGNPGDTSHPIAGATSAQYAATPQNTTTYWVLVSSVCGNASSPAMTVSVCAQPTIKASPQNAATWSGGTATLSVTATNTVTNPNAYQWYRGAAGDTSTPVGTNSPIFTTPALSATTSYWVRVSNGTCNTADSTVATVTVNACPSSETPVADVQSQVGQSVTLTVPPAVVGLPYASLQLSGSSYVRVNNAPALTVSGPLTVEAWVKLNAAGGSAGIVEYLGATSSGNGGYGIRISGGKAYFYVGYDTPDSSQMTSIAGATTVSASVWHHIAGVYDGSQVRVYLDGVLDGSKTAPNGPGHGTENLVIGIYGNEASPAGYFSGLIDEARVTSDALYFNNFAPAQHLTSSTATVGLWTFDARSLADSSANGLSGTAVSSVTYIEDVPGAKQFQWYQGVSGTTTSPIGSAAATTTLSVAPTATTQYWYQLRDGACTSNSTTTTVNVCVPAITTQPTAASITQGQSATLTVAANTAGVTYQWYTGAAGVTTSPVTNGATASITVSPTTTTSYWARATSTCGRTADSNAVTVAVCNPPTVTINSVPSWWIARGGTIQLNLTSSGTGLTYQWYTGNPGDTTSPIAGATGTSYTAAPQNTTSYWVKASGQCGTANSNGVTVNVCAQPTITTQPTSTTIYSNASATLSVVASEVTTTPMTYQWYIGATGDTSAPISGATSSTYTTPLLTTTTNYWVRVSDGNGTCLTADSVTATVTVCAYTQTVGSPTTIQSAVGQTVRIMSPVTNASQYVFYIGNSGDTSHILSSTSNYYYDVAPTVTTNYWNTVNNNVCIANSATTTVNVCIPTFTTQPGSPTINSGTSATLTAAANTSGVTYQWYSGTSGTTTSPISGATSATYTTPALTSAANYWVRATGSCGRTTDSVTASVSICQPPTVTMNTSGTWWIARGSSMNISASGSGTAVTYQWYIGASGVTTSPISGATSLTYTASPQNTTTYWVKATGQCGTANSTAFTVNVCAPPTINTNPASVTIYNSSSTTLTVSASDVTTTPVTYQWYVGASGDTTSPISGATGASYTTPALTATTNYWVRAFNGTCTTADSTTATVTVCAYTQTVGTPQTLYSSPGQTVRVMSPVTNASQYVFYIGNSGDTSHIISSTNNYYYDVAPTVTTNYWNTVNNYVCTANSATTTVNVCIPQMTTQPASVTIASGTSTTLTAAANTAGVTYQWYIGTSGTTTSPISGATASSLTVTPSATTNYWVRATSTCGRTVDSATATVTLCAATQITVQPANANPVNYNQYSTLRVTAAGSNLTYQWYLGQSGDTSRPYPNATSSTFTILLQQTDYYWVRVSGTCGTVNSNAAFMSVFPNVSQLQDQYLTSGSYGNLSVSATGNYLHFQWYYDTGAPIPGAADAPNTSTPPLTSNVGVYCVVTSGAAPWNTNVASLNICTDTYAYTPSVVPGSGNCRTLYSNSNGSTFQWYQGFPGDVSTPLGYYYYQSVCPATTTHYWYRAWSTDSNGNSCYADSPGVTAP